MEQEPNFQFLIGVNVNTSNENNNPILQPITGIDLFTNEVTIEPFMHQDGNPVIIDLEMKICLLNLNAHLTEDDNIIHRDQIIRQPFSIVFNENGLNTPLILNSVVFNKNNNNTIKLAIHNLSPFPFVIKKDIPIFKLIMGDFTPTTMKIINIFDHIFNPEENI